MSKYMNSMIVSKYMINKTLDINKKEKFFWENKQIIFKQTLMKKKLVLVESEMTLAAGHFLDYLFETSNYFKDKKDIYWFLNKKFKFNKIIPPKYCNIKKVIQSNTFNRKQNKFYYLMEELFFFF